MSIFCPRGTPPRVLSLSPLEQSYELPIIGSQNYCSPASCTPPKISSGDFTVLRHLRVKFIFTWETRQKCWELELVGLGMIPFLHHEILDSRTVAFEILTDDLAWPLQVLVSRRVSSKMI